MNLAGVTELGARGYNILAAVLGIVAGAATLAALLVSQPQATGVALLAAIAAIACGVAWLIAAIKG